MTFNSGIYGVAPDLSVRLSGNQEYGAAPSFSSPTYDDVSAPLTSGDYESPGSMLGGYAPTTPSSRANYAPAPAVSSVRMGAPLSTYDRVDSALLGPEDQYSPAPVAPAGYHPTQMLLPPDRNHPKPNNAMSIFDPRHPLMQPPSTLRLPQVSDYIAEPFYRKEMDRDAAVRFLTGLPIGSFVVRPSSVAGCLGLSHVEKDGSIGHGLIHLHTGVNNRYGYSIENSKKTFATMPIFLSNLPGLRLTQYGGPSDVPWRDF